ncbi:arsenate reductase (glutaredoxin) [Galbibacter mesophilus]|uniref:arsenate reductase (glutaredoxin) n=1 Tax=Galbibacter mesophilus TaxID=379069 RepID=UPI00191E79A9|nr:arsenate reductase (glutaredoxin) [Galbibacter mesophilus]MCM5663591.1 arsenate reductase (glutaredoxin) [Galbibacter mesophilus]
MIKIYHNPRCRKSREGLQIIEESGKEYEVVKYLEDVPSEKELRKILNCLDIKPINLVRKNEAIWKENYKNRSLSDDEIIEAMLENPKLIERPIVLKNNVAVIGRPPENIKSIL